MNIFIRVALIILFFFAAIACYTFGVPVGGVLFIILGIVFEGMFWFGIFGKKRKIIQSH